MSGLRERKKEQRERRILDAALDLFRNKGFADTSIEQIAERAEVGVGTLYNYFHSKNELLVAMIARATDDIIEEGASVTAKPPARPVDGVARLLDVYSKHFAAYEKDLMRDMLSALFQRGQSMDGELVEQDFRLVTQIAQLLEHYRSEGLLDERFTTQHAAMSLYSFFIMNFLMYAATDAMTSDDINITLGAQIELFFFGMLTPEIKCKKKGKVR